MNSERYTWLIGAMKQVKWRKVIVAFEEFDAPRIDQLESYGLLPDDYVDFMKRFGGMRLFRSWIANIYCVYIDRFPYFENDVDGCRFFFFAYHNQEFQYAFKMNSATKRFDSSVYSFTEDGKSVLVDDSFEIWIKRLFQRCLSKYGERHWEMVLKLPPSFSTEEMEYLNQYRLLKVNNIRSDGGGGFFVEIYNQSSRSFSFVEFFVLYEDGMTIVKPVKMHSLMPGDSRVEQIATFESLEGVRVIKNVSLSIPDEEDRNHSFVLKRGKGMDLDGVLNRTWID